MLEPYKPKFGKEYVELNGSHQYSMFLATVLDVKPLYDDWVMCSNYHEFVDMCKKYYLFVEPDVIFSPPPSKQEVAGGENITTTFFSGQRFKEPLPKEGSVHVFISKSKDLLIEAKKFGWYSVIIDNRSTNKPFVDHLRFGKILGFPDCCIDFFRKYNNWHKFSHQFETFKNTKGAPSYFCNNQLMDKTYFYIHNIPCSYRCEKTMQIAKKVEQAIAKVEPEFVKRTNEILKSPMLVFGEKNLIIFKGKLKENIVQYTDCEYIQNPARKEDKIDFFEEVKNAGKLSLTKDALIINNKKIKRKEEWFLTDFR